MAPRYLANTVEEEVLSAIETFDPDAPLAFKRPMLIIDARSDADAFKGRLGQKLVSALSDKIKNLNLEYASSLGTHGSGYALEKLRDYHSQLDEPTRTKAKTALSGWRRERVRTRSFEGEYDYASGVGIIMPVSGRLLHYDIALAAEFG